MRTQLGIMYQQSINLDRPQAMSAIHRLGSSRCCSTTCSSRRRASINLHQHLKCKALPDTPDDHSNAQQPTSSSGGRQGSWGSSWGRRTTSVFKQQRPAPSQQTDPAAQPQQQQDPAADSPAAEPVDPRLEASIRMNVDRAAQTLQDIVREVLDELLVEEASAYVLDQDEGDLQLSQAVRGAVVKRLEWLDANFLAGLNAYLSVPGVRDDPELSNLLRTIREETLDLVAARLPPAVQVLNSALSHMRRRDRDGVLQQALQGGQGPVPAATLDALGAAAHQLIDDMEDQQVVADRVLLARLVLLREELRLLAERQASDQFWASDTTNSTQQPDQQQQQQPSSSSQQGGAEAANGNNSGNSSSHGPGHHPFFAFHRSNLPARCAAFLKNLLSVHERNSRLGLLSKTFQEDWVAEPASVAAAAAASKAAAESAGSKRSRMRDTSFSTESKPEAPDIVRPGRLLTTLHAMRQELEVQLVTSGADSAAGAEALALLRRLDDIKVEALVALDRVQRSRPVVGSSSSSSVDGNDPYDYEADLEVHDANMREWQQQ